MQNQQHQYNYQLKRPDNPSVNIQSANRCVKCGHTTSPGADICEHCGVWQLADQCCFCYASVHTGQKFCGVCGNPPQGKECLNCGTHSIFDICPKCEHPVSKGTADYIEQMKSIPEVKDLIQQLQVLSISDGEQIATPIAPDWLNQLATYEKQFGNNAPAVPLATVNNAGFYFNKLDKDVSADVDSSLRNIKREEAEAAKAAAEAAKIAAIAAKAAAIAAEREELRKKIADLQSRVFSSNQEARKYIMSLAIVLPELRIRESAGSPGQWLCNFAGVTHSGPWECERPWMGGNWVGGTSSTFTVETVK